MDFINCIEAGEGENQQLSKLKLHFDSKVDCFAPGQTQDRSPSGVALPGTATFSMLVLTSCFRCGLIYMINKYTFGLRALSAEPEVTDVSDM